MKSLLIILLAAAISLVGTFVILDYMTMPAGAAICSGPCSVKDALVFVNSPSINGFGGK